MIKRLFNLLLCLVLAISMAVPVCGANKKTVEKEPVVISTPEELLALAEACRLDTYSEALTVTLAADIDLSGMDVAPIPVFAGIFDGGGHCITGLQLAKHKELTGVSFEPILANLRKVSDSGGMIRLRCPIIPGINDMEEHLISIGQLADSLKGVQQIELESYHPLGENKALHLGRSHIFHSEFVTEENKRFLLDVLKKHTTRNVIIY